MMPRSHATRPRPSETAAILEYSQSEYKKTVVYSTVLHPTFPSCAARTLH